MPLLSLIHPFDGSEIAVWQITESAEQLLKDLTPTVVEQEELDRIKSPKTRLQWVGSRRLIRHLCGHSLVKDQYGKPALSGSMQHISISHTEGFAAVIISSSNAGIDINRLDKNIENIAHKFINEQEAECLGQGESRLKQIHLFWAAKEAMYKLYGKKEVDFRTHLNIEPFQLQAKGVLKGSILKGHTRDLDIHYIFEKDYVLAYVTDDISGEN
jgi:4'-phosphopantetheinyl transferase